MITSDEEAFLIMMGEGPFYKAIDLHEYFQYKQEDDYDYAYAILYRTIEEVTELATVTPDEDNFVWCCNIPKGTQLPFERARKQLETSNVEIDLREPLTPELDEETKAWFVENYEGVFIRESYYTQTPRLQDLWERY